MVLVRNPKKLNSEKIEKLEILASIGYGINKIARCLDISSRTLHLWLYESFIGEEREEEDHPCESLKELRKAWERGCAEWKAKKDKQFVTLLEKRMDLL